MSGTGVSIRLTNTKDPCEDIKLNYEYMAERSKWLHLASSYDRNLDRASRLGRSLLAAVRALARGACTAVARISKAIIRRP